MKWLRILVLLFVALTIAYVALWFKAQRRQRTKLKAQYEQDSSQVSEKEFMAAEMERFNRGLKPKMLLGVYMLPFALTLFLLYLSLIHI